MILECSVVFCFLAKTYTLKAVQSVQASELLSVRSGDFGRPPSKNGKIHFCIFLIFLSGSVVLKQQDGNVYSEGYGDFMVFRVYVFLNAYGA